MKLFEFDNQNGLAAYVIGITADHAVKRLRDATDIEQWQDMSVRELPLENMTPCILGFMNYRS